jgi:hypothetical protein
MLTGIITGHMMLRRHARRLGLKKFIPFTNRRILSYSNIFISFKSLKKNLPRVLNLFVLTTGQSESICATV